MMRNVDFVVGAQYGDEGKGMIAKLWADRAEHKGSAYEWTGRTGAQNAEHRFVHQACEFCARILPSAAAYRPHIQAVLGAGHCFSPEQLQREAIHLGIPARRIWVDTQAMWLKPEHAQSNQEIAQTRGTTGWGVGAAVAEKVRRKPGTQLVGDCPELKEWLEDQLCVASYVLENFTGPGLVEGSQGALLSLDHGRYPYCTSKNVTVPALCAELGISHRRVRQVVGVVRLIPMRVPGPSGPATGAELSFNEVEQLTGLRLPQHRRLQGDTNQRQGAVEEERLFELSMAELLDSHRLNSYDVLAITFADYHREGNYRVTDYESLHPDTRRLIEQIEEEIAPVVLVRTGQGEHDNIWLYNHLDQAEGDG